MRDQNEDNKPGFANVVSAHAHPSTLPDIARNRIGLRLGDLYAPVLVAPPDERLAELLHQLDKAGRASKPEEPDNGDHSILAGPWK